MKLFLTLILSASILTGISPAEAKITDAVHRALQYLEEQGVVVYCLDGGKKVYRNMYDIEGKPVNYFCCKDGLEWNYQTGQYDTLDNRICGCPGGGHPTEAINVCCKDGRIWDEKTKSYSEADTLGRCSTCPYGGKKVYRNMYDSEGKPVNYFCCKDGLEWNYQTGQYDTLDNRICGCPGGGHPTEAINVCCKDGRIWDEKTESYSEADTLGRCSTCPYDGIPASNNLDCCKDGKLLDSDTGEYTKDDTEGVCKCPEGKESVWTRKKDANGGYVKVCCPKGQWADSNGTCCENGASRDENDLRTCCKEGEKSVYTGKKDANGGDVLVCCPKGRGADSNGKCCSGDYSWDENGLQTCCKEGEHSVFTDKKAADGRHVLVCCPKGQKADSNGNCCKNGASWDENGLRTCCKEGEGLVGTGKKDANGVYVTVCCPKGQMADSNGNCCGEGKESAYTGKKDANGGVWVCCPKGQEADSNGNCCKNGSSRDENNLQTCCKEGEKSVLTGKESADGWSVTVCCPKGQVWDGKACVQPVCEVGSVWCDEQTGKCYSV